MSQVFYTCDMAGTITGRPRKRDRRALRLESGPQVDTSRSNSGRPEAAVYSGEPSPSARRPPPKARPRPPLPKAAMPLGIWWFFDEFTGDTPFGDLQDRGPTNPTQ